MLKKEHAYVGAVNSRDYFEVEYISKTVRDREILFKAVK